MDLNRTDIRIILEGLDQLRATTRARILEEFEGDTQELDVEYFRIVDLSTKLVQHLENLPY